MTAFRYARSRLSSDNDFAVNPLGARTLKMDLPGQLSIYEEGDNLITGTLPDATFEARVLNNLKGSGPVSSPAYSRREGDVPAGCALVVVSGRSGRAARRLEVLLTRASFANASLIASNDLALTLSGNDSELEFLSDDPARNAVRANGDVLLPEGSKMDFGNDPVSGHVTSQKDINIGGDAVIDADGRVTGIQHGGWLSTDPGLKTHTQDDAHAELTPGRSTQAPALDEAQVKQPGGATHGLPGGLYAFTDSDTVAYFSNPNADPVNDTPTRTYHGSIFDGGNETGSAGQLAVSLAEGRFIPNGKVEMSGSARLDSTSGLAAQLALGYTSDGDYDPVNPAEGSLRVKGDLLVRGDAVGTGALITTDEGDLTIRGKSTLSASPDQGLAVLAAGSLKLDPPVGSGHDGFFPNDFDVYGNRDVLNWNEIQDNWKTSGRPNKNLLMGVDDTVLGDGMRIRDHRLNDFVDNWLPDVPGWTSHTTPAGNPLPGVAETYVTNCMSNPLANCVNPVPNMTQDDSGMTIGRYVRLREYLKSVDEGHPNLRWLDFSDAEANEWVRQRIRFDLDNFQEEANRRGLPLQTYLAGTNPYADAQSSDIELAGLVFAGKHVYVNGARNFSLDGSIVAADGSLLIRNIRKGRFHFNSGYEDSLMSDDATKLQPVVFMLD